MLSSRRGRDPDVNTHNPIRLARRGSPELLLVSTQIAALFVNHALWGNKELVEWAVFKALQLLSCLVCLSRRKL